MVMFARKKVVEAPVVEPEPSRPQARPITAGVVPLGTYEELAQELNYSPAALLEEQLRRYLAEKQILIYPYDAVDTYLAAMAEKVRKSWIWRPLREQDRPNWFDNGRSNPKLPDYYAGHGSLSRHGWAYRAYDKAVPIHILRMVKDIQDRFGNQVSFFVSDYAATCPDPFIMVAALDVEPFIFGVWDEPGFGID
jgi:hypothetical protein